MVELEPEYREQIRLVENEYAQSGEFIRGVVGTSATVRGWAVTVWLAVLGIAVDSDSWGLAALAVAVIIGFALIDGYHAWLYVEALSYARRLEQIMAAYYSALFRADDDEAALEDLYEELGGHRYGLYRGFKRFELRELRRARPTVFFQVLYPTLVIVAAAVAALLAAT